MMRMMMGQFQFQSTLPLRGVTSRGHTLPPPLKISIHTPLAGSDREKHTYPYS